MSDSFPQFPLRRRKAHVWKLRGFGFRTFIMSHGWTPCGAFARKTIRGTEYLMFTVCGQDDQHVVRITAKEDHWGDLAAQERQRNAIKRRREFDVLDADGRRRARRFGHPFL
jgi:hypothetical protein